MVGYDERVGVDPACAGGSDPSELPGASLPGLIGYAPCGDDARPTGVMLDLSLGPHDLRIRIVNQKAETLLSLGPFPDVDVIARWRSIVAVSGLVPMLCKENGGEEALSRQLGRIRLGRVRPMARYAVLNGRRPRFLVKRKSARLPSRPVVHREYEIAAGTAI